MPQTGKIIVPFQREVQTCYLPHVLPAARGGKLAVRPTSLWAVGSPAASSSAPFEISQGKARRRIPVAGTFVAASSRGRSHSAQQSTPCSRSPERRR